jgi:hypothetical protein
VTKIVDNYGKASGAAVGRACMPIGQSRQEEA